MAKEDLLLVESIGGVGKNQPTPPTSNVESVHMHAATTNYVVTTHSSIVTTCFCYAWNFATCSYTTQAIAWKPHNKGSICWGFFVVNDNLPSWMLKNRKCCDAIFIEMNKHVFIIYAKDLFYVKDLSSSISLMGPFPWKTTLNMHKPRFVACRKLAINIEKTKKIVKANHS